MEHRFIGLIVGGSIILISVIAIIVKYKLRNRLPKTK